MRKQTKLVAVASAAALLAIGASMTSFAAAGWVEEDGTWYYYDSDGNCVEDEWKKSGDNWYWLDSEEDGAMAVDKLIEDDDNIYYVDSNGVMVKNTWVKVVNEDQDDEDDPAEYHYYYMQSSGKAYKQSSSGNLSKKTIDGKRYAFDEDGVMLYGWVTTDGEMANDEDGWADTDTLYYFGSWEDGAMKTGWQKITVYDSSDEKEDDYDYWFSFKSNGKKRYYTGGETDGVTKTKINSKYYSFDERGVMVYEWAMTNDTASSSAVSTASNWNYFGSPEEGARYYKGWFKVAPPTEDNTYLEKEDYTFAVKDSDDESERWYYADDEGLVSGQIKKIKGKYYGFAPEGNWNARMLTGLCALKMDGSTIEALWGDSSDAINMDSDDLDDFFDWVEANPTEAADGYYLYYFGDDSDQDTDGAMATGSKTISLDGDSYQFYFKKSGGTESRGRGLNGIEDGDYIYRYGMKVKADSDEKYILVYATGDTGDENITVYPFDSTDIRKFASDAGTSGDDYADGLLKGLEYGTYKNEDGDTVRVIYGFDQITDGSDPCVYLVNTSGKIQTSKLSAKKDGDDWYWYALKSNKGNSVMMYTSEKELDPYVKGQTRDLGDWDEKTTSSDIVDLLDP